MPVLHRKYIDWVNAQDHTELWWGKFLLTDISLTAVEPEQTYTEIPEVLVIIQSVAHEKGIWYLEAEV